MIRSLMMHVSTTYVLNFDLLKLLKASCVTTSLSGHITKLTRKQKNTQLNINIWLAQVNMNLLHLCLMCHIQQFKKKTQFCTLHTTNSEVLWTNKVKNACVNTFGLKEHLCIHEFIWCTEMYNVMFLCLSKWKLMEHIKIYFNAIW